MLSILTRDAGAVWPPSTSKENDRPAPSAAARERDTFRRSHTAIERFEEDLLRLEEILRDLKEEYREVRASMITSQTEKTTSGLR